MIRIAHITDLHLLSLAGVGIGRMLNKRLTGWANLRLHRGSIHRESAVREIVGALRADPPDHVIVTGDLTNLSLETEFELCARVLGELDLPASRVSIVPGNHDVYTSGALRAARFESFFSAHLTSDVHDGGRRGSFPFVRLADGIAVIGLSSAVPRLPFIASGRVGAEQLASLRRLLCAREVRDRYPVVLLHHPLINPSSAWKARLEGLEDAALLEAELLAFGRGLVTHGHLHRRIHRRLGPLHVVGATSASLCSPDPDRMAGYNVYEIEQGDLARVSARVLRGPGGFAHANVPMA